MRTPQPDQSGTRYGKQHDTHIGRSENTAAAPIRAQQTEAMDKDKQAAASDDTMMTTPHDDGREQ